MPISRRTFVAGCAALGAGASEWAVRPPTGTGGSRTVRTYQVCLSPDALEGYPDLLATVRAAGVTDVWLTGFLYGYWHYTIERTLALRGKVEAAGMAAHVVDVPLGHPGDSLGAMAGDVPLSPPQRWQPGVRPDGTTYAGTSLHAPATEENADAVRRLQAAGFRDVFLDDDFRLAQAPGTIGGCFCDAHRDAFLRSRGYPAGRWSELLDDVNRRRNTRVLREWLSFSCDELTACFRAQEAAAPHVRLGIMVMVLGAESAGIRLADYRDALFRVGEGHFDDGAFSTVKGKTVELYSSLFHRRYARPERAYSETTAYPADRLSAVNLAAKLAVSTLSDVRNTMFMSGLTPFPPAHWQTLGPAMRKHAAIHAKLAGHTPRGPFKHYRGEDSRLLAEDNPYSLSLATGVPFEATDRPARDGWTFLGDCDARAASEGRLRSAGSVLVCRAAAATHAAGTREVAEDLPGLFALKREVVAGLNDVPYVAEDVPAVCAWYPTARAALVWNLTGSRQALTLRQRSRARPVALAPLDVELVEDLAAAGR